MPAAEPGNSGPGVVGHARTAVGFGGAGRAGASGQSLIPSGADGQGRGGWSLGPDHGEPGVRRSAQLGSLGAAQAKPHRPL
ncbi:hypothetical protein FHP08_10440 [Zeimonas arvi]|uniref:Uncharacterized protein n=1 Tax=Zeimonas arvi TaxID=2498847 RepID=A0A5C8NVP5_9BURK|nr:hypothetical protein FHP08_10440 [Zeimonas arvi]